MSKPRVLITEDQFAVEYAPKTVAYFSQAPGRPELAHSHQTLATTCYRNSSLARGAVPSKPATITPRETQVLQLVAEGLTNRQTAAQMRVSVKTGEKHRQSIMNKLHLHDTAALTRYAVGRGIILKSDSFRVLADSLLGYSGAGAYAQRGPAKGITTRDAGAQAAPPRAK